MELDWWGVSLVPNVAIFSLVVILAIVWSMVWKGIALWHAGRNAHLGWFITLFLVHTLGILDIIYVFLFRRVVPRPQKAPPQREITRQGDLRAQKEQTKRKATQTPPRIVQ